MALGCRHRVEGNGLCNREKRWDTNMSLEEKVKALGPSVSTKGKMVGVHGVGSSKGAGLDRKGYSRSVQE
ncbi:hypothetical protein V6N13_018732 [Hibiscus sabdariffa]|uniref:Uncharacterized protein n=1 Tax=Hibiscus sabdariffa TaxID=183260 RepID=A0ABR2EMU8_9ROSI